MISFLKASAWRLTWIWLGFWAWLFWELRAFRNPGAVGRCSQPGAGRWEDSSDRRRLVLVRQRPTGAWFSPQSAASVLHRLGNLGVGVPCRYLKPDPVRRRLPQDRGVPQWLSRREIKFSCDYFRNFDCLFKQIFHTLR